MRRKVIGYDKTMEYLKKGYGVTSSPMGRVEYIYDRDNDEMITVRKDVLLKLLMNDMVEHKMCGWSKVYYLKEN